MKKSSTFKTLMILLPALAWAATGCAKKESAPEPEAAPPADSAMTAPMTAQAKLASREGLDITGMVAFTEGDGSVSIVAHIEGAPPGIHGLHIHEVGDCSAEDFTSAGGHFNPTGAIHGGPDDVERHAGDLGNIEIGEDGTAHLELSSDMITLGEGENSVVGRGVILHEKADDLVSQPTGAAGSRLACGVVESG